MLVGAPDAALGESRLRPRETGADDSSPNSERQHSEWVGVDLNKAFLDLRQGASSQFTSKTSLGLLWSLP